MLRLPLGALLLLALLSLGGCPADTTSGTLVGTVKTESGTPVAGAAVSTVPASATVTTDSLGAFVLTYLTPGNYLVRAASPGFLSDSSSCTVTRAETTSVSLVLRSARRRVAAEMISTVCVCSRPERMALYALVDSLGDSVVHVEYHASDDTLAYYWEPFICPAAESRRLYYAPTFRLGGWLYLDGRTERQTMGDYRRLVDSLLRISSPVLVGLQAVRSGADSVTATVQLDAVDGIGPGVGLGVGLYELGPVSYENSPGDTSVFRNIVLDLVFTDTLSLNAGETRTFQRSLAIPDTLSARHTPFHIVDKNNIGVYVILQDFATRQVLQAARLRL